MDQEYSKFMKYVHCILIFVSERLSSVISKSIIFFLLAPLIRELSQFLWHGTGDFCKLAHIRKYGFHIINVVS